MFGFSQQSNIEKYKVAFASMMDAASELADAILLNAPARGATADELAKIERFIVETVVSQARERFVRRRASSVALALLDGPLADNFRRSFNEMFYSKAPLVAMVHRGQA